MSKLITLLLILTSALIAKAQSLDCQFKEPVVNIHFGSGTVADVNSDALYNYSRVRSSCPTDGHYNYVSYTSDCFRGDWQTVTEDHTPGDADGNMLLVNASYNSGVFFSTAINGLKANTTYEFSVWMMNVCRITEKCPFPLLPNILVQVLTPGGRVVAQFSSGELVRHEGPHWTPYRAVFTTPETETPLRLIMINNVPGGCGNDFALDDIMFRECQPITTTAKKTTTPPKPKPKQPATVKQPPVVKKEQPPVVKKTQPPVVAKTQPPVVAKTQPPAVAKTQPPVVPKQQPPAVVKKQPPVVTKQQAKPPDPVVKKEEPVKRPLQTSEVRKTPADTPSRSVPVTRSRAPVLAPPPPVLVTRSNPVIKLIQTEAAEIKLDLYDNGDIDGDTVSIYHNNKLLVSHARISQKPITFKIAVNEDQPHHELVMVAENLGSIPPNTSLMIVTAGAMRYEVFISSTIQKNAKIVIDLKK